MTSQRAGMMAAAGLVAVHSILFFTMGDPVATVAPALLIGLAVIPETWRFQKKHPKMRPRPLIAALVAGSCLATTVAAFYFPDEEISFKLRIARAMLADCTAVLVGACLVTQFNALKRSTKVANS